jgi:hypothetical protein
VAVNCLEFPAVKLVLVGEIVMLTTGATATVALARFVLSAALVAVTVTFVLLVTFGAVKRPLLETVPAVELQVTPVLVEFLTVALNCWDPPDPRFVLVGEIVILTAELELLTTVICA